ncbi:Dabb family protein [Clostridium sp.]|uniref:Dabb family protein n=1 Tax=Clostridium sp. TaxID=1506 RepID=UPI003991EA19
MIKHIVMWKLKEENKEKNAMKIKNDLEALKDKIEELKSIEVGINFNESEAAYDVVLYSEFESKEDLDSYQNNKDHKEVGAFVRTCVIDRKVVDYIK